MAKAKAKDQDQLIGQLPGTGGDFIGEQDVEGHRAPKARDAEPDGARAKQRDGGPEGLRVADDVEGHRLLSAAPDELYKGGPTTQGEIVRRGPGDNPHGER